jgi:hypothetical protein
MLTLLVVKIQVDSNEENIRIAFRYLNALIFPFASDRQVCTKWTEYLGYIAPTSSDDNP